MVNEDKTFERFVVGCSILGFFFLICGGYVLAFGVPNFSNLEEQGSFCFNNGGQPIQPSRENYNTMLCMFYLNDTYVEYVVGKINKEGLREVFGDEWRNKTGLIDDYCFSCWDNRSCTSPHNEILRERGLHC